MLFITINNDSPTPSPDRPYKIYKNGSYSPSRFTLSEGEKVLGLIPVASVIPCGNSISIPGWREADFVPLASVTQGWLNGHPLLSKAGKRIYTLVDNGSQRRIWGWVPSQAAMTPGYGITSIKIVNRRQKLRLSQGNAHLLDLSIWADQIDGQHSNTHFMVDPGFRRAEFVGAEVGQQKVSAYNRMSGKRQLA